MVYYKRMSLFLESKEYQDMKVKYEKEVFKLFDKYCTYDDDKVEHKTPSDVAEYFKNKKVYINDVEEKKSKKGDVTTTTVCRVKTFYEVWSEDPKMKEYKEVVFNCNVKKVKASQFNLFSVAVTGESNQRPWKAKGGNQPHRLSGSIQTTEFTVYITVKVIRHSSMDLTT
jgi:hypothetical protein